MGIFRAPKTILILSIVFIIAKISVQGTLGMSSRWLSTSPLPKGLSNSAVVSDGNSIYFIGGGLTPATPNDSPEPIKDVYRAQLLENGKLSDWSLVTPLLDPLVGHAAVTTKSMIYVIGGVRGLTENDLSRDTMYATLQSDGSLSSWVRSNYKLPIGISTHSAVVAGDYIYIFGGYSGSQASSLRSVYRTRILADGTISAWEPLLNMRQSVYRHTSIVYENKVYIIGGRERRGDFKKPLNSVYIGQIDSDGKINNWFYTEALSPPGLYFHGAIISEAERKIYTFGGYDGSLATDKVYSAKLRFDGTLEPWVEVEDFRLPKELFRHSVILSKNGSVYLLGGEFNKSNINSVYYIPPLSLTKSADPPGPVHEGDVITYTIVYANTGLTTQTITLTDQIPFNVTLEPDSISAQGYQQGSQIIWPIGETTPGYSDHVSFRVRVPLLPSLNQISISSEPPPPPPADSPAYVLPAAVSCDTTRFWANGVTRQPPTPNPHTIEVQIPADAAGLQLALWLAVSGQVTTPPTIGGQPAQQLAASNNSFGASIWTADLTPEMLTDGQITVVTHDPCQLNAVFLFDKHDPPFDLTALDDFTATSKTFTYTLDLPSVMTQTMSMLLPFLDLNYWDGSQPNTALTTVTTHFDQQSQTLRANQPNLGNGLLLTHFPLTIGPQEQKVVTKSLTVQVTTEDSLYTLGPRICRPVLIENTAWLCSDKAGCISATAANVPENFMLPNAIYLPIILK